MLRTQQAAHRRPIPARVAARLRTDAPLAVLDGGLAYLVYMLALALRFDGGVPAAYWAGFHRFAPLAIAVHIVTNLTFGLYGRVWRYASIQEARRIAGASAVAFPLIVGSTFATRDVPLSVAILGYMLAIAAFAAVRFQSRLFGLRRREVVGSHARVLVVGAGATGARIVQDMHAHPEAKLEPVGILDDDPRTHGKAIHGVPVLGDRTDVGGIIRELSVDQVVLAMPDAEPAVYRSLLELCEEHEVPMRVLPRLSEMLGGAPGVRDIRDIQIEDLIGRDLVETDLASVEMLLRGHRVLITGAGGSIGSEIARQVARFAPAALILVEHDETHLHDLITDLEVDPATTVHARLADVRDEEATMAAFEQHRPDVVFHAAAHKHVPLLEEHPAEAIKTNIIGTANVGEAALRTGAKRFILISTDKAINAVSVMGASKQIAEQVVRSLNGRGCRFSAVRFGNVLGSRGSVIPTFMRQIRHGGPVTVTDRRMTRYFMSVSEAVQLVLQAATMTQGGEVFTLDMGEPVQIDTLARRMIRLAGKTPDRDIPVEYVGVRPGERLNEPIASPAELSGPSSHPRIFRSVPPELPSSTTRATIRELLRLAHASDADGMRARMRDLAQDDRTIDLTDSFAPLPR